MEFNSVLDGADPRTLPDVRLAGGTGALAAVQTPIQKLRRLASTFLLWESSHYQSNAGLRKDIKDTVAICNPQEVADLAVEIRINQGIRHAPLMLLVELVRRPEARQVVGRALPDVIQRADEITMFLELYWADGKVPVAAQVKKGLSEAFMKFDAYGFAKYKDEGKAISLRDVLHIVHAKPHSTWGYKWTKTERKEAKLPPQPSKSEILFSQLSNMDLPAPKTREVLLSAATSTLDKKNAYEQLLRENSLGPQALLMNLKGMTVLGVDPVLIKQALSTANPTKILPLQFFSAVVHAPGYMDEISALMRRCLSKYTLLKGKTVLVVDCSGSMANKISSKGEFSRLDCVLALTIMAREVCQDLDIYLTAGDDGPKTHKTEKLRDPLTGFNLSRQILNKVASLGMGGIFTRQTLDYIRKDFIGEGNRPERIVVLSDSEDCDISTKLPSPFGKYNYIINVASSSYGIDYKGVWTSEISGWSQMFIEYIAQSETSDQQNLF
jgi:hypothetical protein